MSAVTVSGKRGSPQQVTRIRPPVEQIWGAEDKGHARAAVKAA